MSRARDKAATADEEGFLARWSRRKQEAASAPELEESAREPDVADAPATEEAEAAPDDTLDDAALAEKYGLPDPNALQAADDFSPFLQGQAPERLRRIAMRRLWRLKPELANLDGLLEYGEDYTDAATVVANLATDYVVGRGFAPAVDTDDAPDEPVEQDEQSADAQEGDVDTEIGESAADEGGQADASDAGPLDVSQPPADDALLGDAGEAPLDEVPASDSLHAETKLISPFPVEVKSSRPRRMRFH